MKVIRLMCNVYSIYTVYGENRGFYIRSLYGRGPYVSVIPPFTSDGSSDIEYSYLFSGDRMDTYVLNITDTSGATVAYVQIIIFDWLQVHLKMRFH